MTRFMEEMSTLEECDSHTASLVVLEIGKKGPPTRIVDFYLGSLIYSLPHITLSLSLLFLSETEDSRLLPSLRFLSFSHLLLLIPSNLCPLQSQSPNKIYKLNQKEDLERERGGGEKNVEEESETMTLKDFHGGSIPSDLPLPSAPGV